MLPTHIIRSDGTIKQSSDHLSTDSLNIAMHQYPPTNAGSNGRHTGRADGMHLLSSRGITAFTVQTQAPLKEQSNGQPQQPETVQRALRNGVAKHQQTKPPKWNTWEFRFYAFVFITIVPLMCWVPIRLSLASSRNFPLFSQHLERGWIFGRLRDDSDFQYKSFRDYVPVLLAVMAAFLGLSKLTEQAGLSSTYQPLSAKVVRPNRVLFLTVFTAIFVLALHGLNTLKLISACAINFAIANLLKGTPLATPAIWGWNVALLYTVHYYDGFSYERISTSLSWMDEYHGLLPRWQINYNITMLRLVSFALDLHWAQKAAAQGSQNEPASAGAPIGEPRRRGELPLPLTDYSFLNYMLYALYPPLFIAGPIMTFNDFTRQLHNPLPLQSRYTILYAIRWAFSMLSMEFILHFMYVNAIKDAKAWRGATPMELSMIGFWNLIVVWLKLLLPWRFFRLWALADGVDAPENMVRCMANNYSTLGFWRSWHRSYNLWIVRYIYVPVGGAKNAIPATLLVFTFVALWHDLSLKLLTWGWLVTLFILPEVAARHFISSSKFGQHWWFRHVCAAGGVVNVLMMMTANLIGFAIGTDGMSYMWQQLLNSWEGLTFMLAACGVLFVGVQVMFEYREEELRRGIDRKC